MSFPEERSLTRSVTTVWAYLTAFVCVGVGLWLASLDMSTPPEWWERLINTVGNALFALGAISFLYELALRRHVQRELIALVGMQGSITESRIIAAGKAPEIDWRLILGGKTQYALLLLTPLQWIEANWHLLADSFSLSRSACRLFIPDPDAAYIPILATYLNVPEDDYRAELRRAATLAEDRWKLGVQERRFRGGHFSIRLLDVLPTYGIVIADRFCVITKASSVGRVGDDPDYVVVYEGRIDAYPVSWFHQQLVKRQPGRVAYSDGDN